MTEPHPPDTDVSTAPVSRQYLSVNGPDGDLVIFDSERRNGWMQSDVHVALGATR